MLANHGSRTTLPDRYVTSRSMFIDQQANTGSYGPKPNNDAPANDYQSKGILVRLSEVEPDDDPSSDYYRSNP
jgi:hypothetical protein